MWLDKIMWCHRVTWQTMGQKKKIPQVLYRGFCQARRDWSGRFATNGFYISWPGALIWRIFASGMRTRRHAVQWEIDEDRPGQGQGPINQRWLAPQRRPEVCTSEWDTQSHSVTRDLLLKSINRTRVTVRIEAQANRQTDQRLKQLRGRGE